MRTIESSNSFIVGTPEEIDEKMIELISQRKRILWGIRKEELFAKRKENERNVKESK